MDCTGRRISKGLLRAGRIIGSLVAALLIVIGGSWFWYTHQAWFNEPIGDVYNAISGSILFLERGQAPTQTLSYYNTVQPRTAVALDSAARQMLLVAVDGRQPNYSEGVTLAELAEIVIGYGGDTALNLDGGGSTTLVMEGNAGEPVQLNSPIDNRIPGRERPVANHLGIYCAPAAQP